MGLRNRGDINDVGVHAVEVFPSLLDAGLGDLCPVGVCISGVDALGVAGIDINSVSGLSSILSFQNPLCASACEPKPGLYLSPTSTSCSATPLSPSQQVCMYYVCVWKRLEYEKCNNADFSFLKFTLFILLLFSLSEEVSVTNLRVGSYWVADSENWNHESLHIYDFDPWLSIYPGGPIVIVWKDYRDFNNFI